MRRQGHVGDSAADAYAANQMQLMRMEHDSQFQGQLEAFTPERDQPFSTAQEEGQWRWERDDPNLLRPIMSPMFNEGQGIDMPRQYLRGQMDSKIATKTQSSNSRAQIQEENLSAGYGDNLELQTFEGLEQKFVDDLMKLAKDQFEAEDAEIARHREKIKAINGQFDEQLAALRTRHASRRAEFLRKESHMWHQQYQQAMVEQYRKSSEDMMAAGGGVPEERFGGPYGERSRGFRGPRDHPGFASRAAYSGGRVYDNAQRYY